MALFEHLGVFSFVLVHAIGTSKALFEGCDYTYDMGTNPNVILQSPNYPNNYPIGTSCRYAFIAPLDYEILAQCTVSWNRSSSACSTEYFWISTEGDKSLSTAEHLCQTQSLTRTSLFREFVFAYTSSSTDRRDAGNFICKLTSRPQACNCGWSPTTQQFIVGGVEASQQEFRSMVALYHLPTRSVFCGGTIITHYAILTAAHCTRLHKNPRDVLILAGYHSMSTGNQYQRTYAVSSYNEHAGYNSVNNANDIALVMTNTAIQWSRGIGPICLPLDQMNNSFDYFNVYVVGWGTTQFGGYRSDTLQKAAVNTIPNLNCQNVYPSLMSSQICTYFPNRDSCQFDSGGPVIYKATRQFQIGIISSGIGCGSGPGLNTRVTSFIYWIASYPVGTLCHKPFTSS